jgi:hypothetical protein
MHSRMPPLRLAPRLLAAVLALGAVSLAGAQPKPPDKKLYCWDEGGRRVCSDALPASAVGRQRTEFDQRTGTATNRVGRELTPAERARAAIEDEARKADEQRKRREMAMVVSYETEEDLKRAFRERFDLVEESLKGSELAMVNLHKSLISLLRQANELELQSKPVNKPMREKIREQHAELQALRAMKQRQLIERSAVNNDFEQALSRYRTLKSAKEGDTSVLNTAPVTSPGG